MKSFTAFCLLTLFVVGTYGEFNGTKVYMEEGDGSAVSPNKERLSPWDPNSFSRPDNVKVTDLDIDLMVDFERKILTGSVVLSVEKVNTSSTVLLLDVTDLDVTEVQDVATGQVLEFSIGHEGYVGSRMEIRLSSQSSNNPKLKIFYSTQPSSTALQWMTPAQTAGKVHPYLYSQCQAIHCRSMIPCQDTPSVKATYSARITVPKELTVLMSAIRQGDPETADADGSGGFRTHRFHQKIAVQSYLIAIAVGDIVSRKIGPRSSVWSEKEFVDKAAIEFADTEVMLQKAEELSGPYVWGIYDILVLPPSFPYGGMENPCLTFVTPTLLAGDKSSKSLIAHEIAHSWTGNLVTNLNFEHFWLNEGFTMFTERKILGRMGGGEQTRDFAAIGGWKSLKETIDRLGKDNPKTALVVDLSGVHPDDVFSTVPYEKGSTFLWYLEDTVGGPAIFEPFLRAYYEAFKYKSIDSYQFKQFFLEYFKDKDMSGVIDWEGWFKNPGMPVYRPDFDDSLAKVCMSLKDRWLGGNETAEESPFGSRDLEGFSTGQKIEFLALLLEEKPLSILKLEKMRELYGLDATKNFEIRFRWIRLGLKAGWKDAVPMAVQMVSEVGRMKFLRPIYRDLYKRDETRDLAIETFYKNKESMMHVAIRGVETDLNLRPKA